MQHYSDELKAKILTEFKQKQSVMALSNYFSGLPSKTFKVCYNFAYYLSKGAKL